MTRDHFGAHLVHFFFGPCAVRQATIGKGSLFAFKPNCCRLGGPHSALRLLFQCQKAVADIFAALRCQPYSDKDQTHAYKLKKR